jgi:hypothetical protein
VKILKIEGQVLKMGFPLLEKAAKRWNRGWWRGSTGESTGFRGRYVKN